MTWRINRDNAIKGMYEKKYRKFSLYFILCASGLYIMVLAHINKCIRNDGKEAARNGKHN